MNSLTSIHDESEGAVKVHGLSKYSINYCTDKKRSEMSEITIQYSKYIQF